MCKFDKSQHQALSNESVNNATSNACNYLGKGASLRRRWIAWKTLEWVSSIVATIFWFVHTRELRTSNGISNLHTNYTRFNKFSFHNEYDFMLPCLLKGI